MLNKHKITIILATAGIYLSGCGTTAHVAQKNLSAPSAQSAVHTKITQASLSKPSLPKKASPSTDSFNVQHSSSEDQQPKASNPLPEWERPTGGAYPVLKKDESLWIRVSVPQQKVYIMHNNQVLYTMIASSGLDTDPNNSTPEGTFHIQKERGLTFYFPPEKEGAKYWVSWKNHGEFLFHSVPVDNQGDIIVSEAKKLGHKASHGCVRLSVPDAKWFYENIPLNTKVVIGK